MTRSLRHVDASRPHGPLYRLFARFFAARPFGWLSQVIGWKIDPWLDRLTGGRVSFAFFVPTAVLEHRGAKTGTIRRNVLIYFHDGDRVTLVASKLGLPEHPAWFHNVQANPDVVFGGQPYRAVVVTDEAEHTRLLGLADNVFPPYASYRERAARTGRTIPVIQLVPARR